MTAADSEDQRGQIDDLYARSEHVYQDPPEGFWETLKHLGPGLILVGSIVGSGELIMTTKLGAQAGFVMLWFVILSCLIKVVVQAEMARHTISSGQTFLTVFNSLPGPSILRPVWFTWEWLAVVMLTVLGAVTFYMGSSRETIVGLSILAGTIAISAAAAWLIPRLRVGANGPSSNSPSASRPRMNWFLWIWMICQMGMFLNGGAILGGAGQSIQLAFPDAFGEHGARVWAVLVGITCAALLLGGRYNFLERISLGMVFSFTLITAICTALLQWTDYAISVEDLREGLTFAFPSSLDSVMLMTVLAVYAATGIGHWEMPSYTYWCIEKGYARYTGANQPGEEWARRARGWVRVMYIDALLTMVVYTASTICFYLLGAAILHAENADPKGIETLSVLQSVYTESLGNWAATLFVVGAFFVLFSTSVSGIAGSSRIMADALCVFGFIDRHDYTARLRFIRIAIVLSLSLNGYAYFLFEDPPLMLMITGMIAVFMYPVAGLGTIYLRYRGVDERIQPGKTITVLLWICGLALGIISPCVALAIIIIKLG